MITEATTQPFNATAMTLAEPLLNFICQSSN
jgi:hypothetical protein